MLVLVIVFTGCAGKKGVIKDELRVDADDDEKKDHALKLFKEGADLLFENDQEALVKFDQARELDPSLIAAHFNAGVAAEGIGSLPEAKVRYEACLAIDKTEGNCLGNLLLTEAKLGEEDAAWQRVDVYLNEFPDTPFALVAAAKLAFYRKDYVRAEKLARDAIERDAENVEALYVMARIFYEQKRYPAAKWVAKNALEIAPMHGGLRLTLGHTELALDLLHDALEEYEKAVEYQPTEEALESYGLLLLTRGRVKEALPVLERLRALRPEVARHHFHLGNAYMANKGFEEAKASYLKAAELDPEDKDVYFNLGLLFNDMKPKDLPELDRLKTAQEYFKAYLAKGGVSKERLAETNEYLKQLNQKIEMEEYAAQSAREAAEESEKEEAAEENEEEGGDAPEPSAPVEDEPKAIEPTAPKVDDESLKELDEEKNKPVKEEKPAPAPKKEEPEGFDEEEEDFLEDL